MAGAFGFFMIYQVTGIGGKVKSGAIYIEIVFAVVGALIGLFVGSKLQFAVKTIGTAFIGAFLFTLGVSQYAGHLQQQPDEA